MVLSAKLHGSGGVVAGWEQQGDGHLKDCPARLRVRATAGEEILREVVL